MPDTINLCGRCLIVVDHSMLPLARISNNPDLNPPGTSPRQIIQWVVDLISRHGDAVIFLDAFGGPGAIRAVSTWHGDLICELHLRDRVTDEWRHLGA